ncbi:MAG: hypothetical protein AB8B79_02835 [Granulosicoccus sp.]
MEDLWLNEAISNNAAWCDAIAASHGISAHRNESVWLSKQPMPPLYPNIVTLRSGAVIDKLIDTINPHLPSGWGIKDSYCELELEVKGFSLAFEAQWYCRLPNQHVTEEKSPNFQVKTVRTPSELDRWAAAWGEGGAIFNPSLLVNNSIELVYVERDGEVVSGLATNQSGDSVGITNAFGPHCDIVSCIASLAGRYPMKGIVGYDGKSEVEALCSIGFKSIGGLQVWLHD